MAEATVESVKRAGELLRKWKVKPETAIYLLPHLALALAQEQERYAKVALSVKCRKRNCTERHVPYNTACDDIVAKIRGKRV